MQSVKKDNMNFDVNYNPYPPYSPHEEQKIAYKPFEYWEKPVPKGENKGKVSTIPKIDEVHTFSTEVEEEGVKGIVKANKPWLYVVGGGVAFALLLVGIMMLGKKK